MKINGENFDSVDTWNEIQHNEWLSSVLYKTNMFVISSFLMFRSNFLVGIRINVHAYNHAFGIRT